MSLADGLNAGFNMALNLAKFQSDEEERKKNAAYIDSRIAYTNSLEEKNRQTIESLIAAEKRQNLKDQGMDRPGAIARADLIFNDFSQLQNDYEGQEKDANYFATSERYLSALLELDAVLPLRETVSKEALTASANIEKNLVSGNFEALLTDNINDLNVIFRRQTNDLIGSKYIGADGQEGTIKGLSLTSNVIAEGQENALLDVVADVDFGDGEIKKVGENSLLLIPEKDAQGQRVFRDDLDQSDAKAVSVRDLVDYVSSDRLFKTELQKNPEALGAIKDMLRYEKISIPSQDNSVSQNALINLTNKDLQNSGTRWNLYITTVAGLDTRTEEGISEAVSLFHKQYPTSEKPEEFEKDGVTLFRPPGGKTYQEYIMPAVPSTENSYNRVSAIYGDNPPPFDEGDGIIGGRVIKNSGIESILSDLQTQLQVMGEGQYYQDFYDEVVSPNIDSPKFRTLTAEDILKEYENWVAETKK